MDGIRLHIGTGCIYLTDGWTNIDVWGSGAALAADRPKGVEKWGTTESDYYGKVAHIDAAYLGTQFPDHEGLVCDKYGTWTDLPFEDETVSEIMSRQTFEHLSKTESRYALMEARRVMKVGANLRLDVPDHAAALEEYSGWIAAADGDNPHVDRAKCGKRADFMLRHLLGSQKNDWAYHMGSWTREKLIAFCKPYGFKFIEEEPNIHFYPAFCLRFEKLSKCDFAELNEPIHPWLAAHEYCGKPRGALDVPASWKVLEVGPGTAPWPRANAYCDIVHRDLPNFTCCDVQKMPHQDKSFDFALVSHVMEHVQEPLLAAAELSRVAKNGVIISPTPFKEGMFLSHEQDHKWWVMSGREKLYFYRIPSGSYRQFYDQEISGEMHRIWRYGERRLEGLSNKCKRHFHNIEPLTDAIHYWSPEQPLKVQVLE